MVDRVYVEKKPGFDIEAQHLLAELRSILGVKGLTGLRILNRYDVEGLAPDLFEECVPTVFSEPPVDNVYFACPTGQANYVDAAGTSDTSSSPSASEGRHEGQSFLASGESEAPDAPSLDFLNPESNKQTYVFAVEPLPGQFDQRADSASECIQLISQGERPPVHAATVYVLEGDVSSDDIQRVKSYVINPVEAREASLKPVETLVQTFPVPDDVEVLDGFRSMDDESLSKFISERGLAMDLADIKFLQKYFAEEEKRDPTITEVKMVDTYWSDHCRHTTFGTQLTDMQIADANVQEAFDRYMQLREELGRSEKPVTLMDMGTIGARYLKHTGDLVDLDESEEINACTVRVKVDVDGEEQDWLYLFKNETHNHPTEIEPFGGAATCVGGAIRDPLSGRSYVYQAMRVTGAADPRVPVEETIPGKLPQRKLVITAAEGYSSYGNQIGLATGEVHELYHPGYAAKRMEIGAVVGATPANHVRRETPAPGDVVVLLGGRTGRDGIGGATGSSKAHSSESLEECGAEVQKGNAPVERKIQRLFRRGDACRMIKRCNDFGAGGVSVAIGELADGLQIRLDDVPLKYAGLDGTEIAISESQERMAVALAPEDVEVFCELAREENLEATPVAVVTEEPRVRMDWRGKRIVDVSRDFLASNGAPKQASVCVEAPAGDFAVASGESDASLQERFEVIASNINFASNKGLSERFDSTIGAATVLMPFGGENQLTPSQAMVAKLPVLGGKTTSVSGLSWGFDPYLTQADPFVGSYIAVLQSVAKLVATGFERHKMYLTFQEYFEKLRDEPARWGKPFAALLGALDAQVQLKVGAIGGKDSMSGSFEKLDVPPTLVSFATAVGNLARITSPEFKQAGHKVVAIKPRYRNGNGENDLARLLPETESMLAVLDAVEQLIGAESIQAAASIGSGAAAETVLKMCVGNRLGLQFADGFDANRLFCSAFGAFILEMSDGVSVKEALHAGNIAMDNFEIVELGETTEKYELTVPGAGVVDMAAVQEVWESTLEDVFPYRHTDSVEAAEGTQAASESDKSQEVPAITYTGGQFIKYGGRAIAQPHVVVPVFPGTNCEYDTQAAFEQAGAKVTTFIVNNLNPEAVRESTKELVRLINDAQIVMLPGGFSGGDEPDGSAKFINAFFRAPEVTEAVRDLLQNRDGLMLGICNGFQALVKLGLVPYGDIVPASKDSATLTFNQIGRHQSRLVHTRVASNLSPWLANSKVGDVHTVAISHGEGRFVAPPELLEKMVNAGQVATQYVDSNGVPSMSLAANPNGSVLAIEGITSMDGRVFGKMGHSERRGAGLYKNVPGEHDQTIFEAGVAYFS